MIVRRKDKRIRYLLPGVFVAVFLFSFLVQRFKNDGEVDAASLAGFDPGYIISDYQMGRYNAMSEAEIQSWLTSKNSCGNRDYGYYVALSGNSSYKWHFENGHFICLSEERFGNNDNEIGFQYGETAAHIIWQAAQDYRINPQVLLVLLQKETGLITDPIPNNGDYRKATGFGCPDTAACSSKYYGFKNQVRNAAALFRTVLDGGWTNYPLGNNYIQYNPNAACGGSVVNIRSLATSALYRYTPYQPNAGALAAGYGTASCGAYGNRNFYLYFEDWFGGITKDGLLSKQEIVSRNRVATEQNDLAMYYQLHISHYGWLDCANGGEMNGTVGYGLQSEALAIKLADGLEGISYQVHVSGEGWQDAVSDGAMAGSVGKGLGIEAVRINLSNELLKRYDIYYRVHAAGIGWMDWVKNGEIGGTTGQGRWIEAIQIKTIKKINYDNLDINYSEHSAGIGWMDWVKNGEVGGTTGQSRRLEAIKVEIKDEGVLVDGALYQVHAAGIGWMDWVKNGEVGGTTGQSRQLEAIRIELPDSLLKKYDVYYRVHAAGIGWMDWVKNGEVGGTTGQSRQLEAMEVKLVKKK